jgi:hypothetical protein
MPKLYDLDSAIYRIQHRTKKSVAETSCRFLPTLHVWRQQARAHRDRACPLAGPKTCPFAIARLRCAVWCLPLRQFRPRPESAMKPSRRVEDAWRFPSIVSAAHAGSAHLTRG